MLEGAVARLLNQLLGKYVVDLDTENLNVGIFSGHVQLTDLKLKAEALYELDLPIEVIAGTIGKVWLQIPWNMLWNQPVVVNIEDVHIVASPIIGTKPYDEELNKRLLRAMKRKALQSLNTASDLIGGPSLFSEYLIANIINNLQLNVSNVHIRYEDNISGEYPIAAGICISSITAETTNSKWKASKTKPSDTTYYLIKMEALSVYWNPKHQLVKWDLPSQYYAWRNSMSSSLQNFSMNDEDFDFLIKPMTMKIKMTINKSSSGNITKVLSDIVMQDCNIQISRDQYQSILRVHDSFSRMFVSWNFFYMRPNESIKANKKAWWQYAYHAVIEQRIKPYTWSRIRNVRETYKDYLEIYKKILLNPNDTELKLDLQKYEDKLSVVNIIIARQQARLIVHSASLCEKSFWDILPSPERSILCEKIGFQESENPIIEHIYNLRIGNVSVSLVNSGREILVATATQMIAFFQPNFIKDMFKFNLKVEALIVEGASVEEHLIPILTSEHIYNSPAYFLKFDVEKMPKNSESNYNINFVLESLEMLYHQHAYQELKKFFNSKEFSMDKMIQNIRKVPSLIFKFLSEKLMERWKFNFNIKFPYIVLPEQGSMLLGQNILILDFGQHILKTELGQIVEGQEVTQMELEEQLYSRFHIDCSGAQILFCDNSENWKEAIKEKDTELHLMPKCSFSSTYASFLKTAKNVPKKKFNISFPIIKLNISERKLGLLLKFFNWLEEAIFFMEEEKLYIERNWKTDTIKMKFSSKYLQRVQNSITIYDTYIKTKRNRINRNNNVKTDRRKSEYGQKDNINEAWARTVDLPGLEDNISPNNNINILLGFIVKEFQVLFSRSSDSTDRPYLMVRLGLFSMDAALMTYGPAFQLSVNSVILTDKLHTTPSGQYLDLIHSTLPSTMDVLTILYRKVSAGCPDFWTHFHGVETSLVVDVGSLNLIVHQESVHTIIKYYRYLHENKLISDQLVKRTKQLWDYCKSAFKSKIPETPVPPGSVKFSHSGRLSNVNMRICDSDFDIINIHLAGLEMDFLFRANERFIFRSYLSTLSIDHLSDLTLYSKILSTDEDKVFEVKYVQYAPHLNYHNDIAKRIEDLSTNGSFKFQLGQIHFTFLYKLIVQMQRFIINLEAFQFFESSINYLRKKLNQATETLKANSKIQLAINVKGPVILLPQKSSSPNVIIINTGDINVENFFKEYPNERIENILVKLQNITVNRGIMTLAPSLEMQEVIIEPVSVHLDIKRYTFTSKNAYKALTWDIDGVMDTINITLGQRDLSTIIAIYTDNIGEGKFFDLFPNVIKSPISEKEDDQTVKTLEAFFCEPKHRDITAKICFEGIQLTLFFDSGELLSSPIRDLNHGLCKLVIEDVMTSFTVYTDRSLDGKLAVDSISIEEIGPDANSFEKGILHSPIDDNKNNNCHITVNKPPIIDITFHKNKNDDKSIDVIIGRLSLCLSVPFCEKLSLFVLECLPKENIESGIVNHGYVADQVNENSPVQKFSSSLTVSIRINRPEFVFIVETTSNKKRYFITKTEILSDYSRHGNRINLVISLSGLHSLFYELGVNALEQYIILKQCDVELSKSFTEQKGEKITATVSSINIQLCDKVVHSINDIFNDIIEHFKIPEVETIPRDVKKSHSKSFEIEDLWEAKKISEYIPAVEEEFVGGKNPQIHEVFLLQKTDVVVIFELEQNPVLLVKSTLEMTVHNWSSLLNCTCELTIQGNYFNDNIQNWEPFIDPIVIDEHDYKPWEVFVKVFQDKALPMLKSNVETPPKKDGKGRKPSNSRTSSEDEEESGDDMVYLKPSTLLHNRNNRRVKTSLSTFLDDSDSENEEGTMEKLAAAISDLFTGDWNESEGSDCEQSSDGEDESEEEQKSKSQDAEAETINYKKGTYILVDAKEVLNITLTPAFIKVLNDIFTMYSNKTISIGSNKKVINLVNDIGPQTKVELFENKGTESHENNVLVCMKTYETQDSCPNSPTKSYFNYDYDDDDKDSYTEEMSKLNQELGYDFEITNSLQFPVLDTATLYDRINKHHIKIHVPGFQTIQTSCPKKSWQKIMRMHSTLNNHIYYLVAKHSIGKQGRIVTVSSPLQIRNETCFALSVLYQPSVLQELNLEPVGDVTNPFESTMRIAVLEAHEHFNVPLYIAYHCKLFIQPAYAEGHYTAESGIWWKDLCTELDIAHNYHCKPKEKSNLEVFSLRVVLKRNIVTKRSYTHWIPNFVIHLLPPLILHNFMPYSIEVQNVDLKQQMKVEPGEKTSIYSLNLSKDQKLLIKITYAGTIWTGTLNITAHLYEKVILLSTDSKMETTRQLAINVKSEKEMSYNIFFYTPYWIVNKTGLPIHIKASSSNVVYESVNEDIILFTYKRHGKQSLNLRVYESDWSNDFGLDCAETTGLIVCKDNERKKRYTFLLSIRLSKMCPRLTKVVTLSPIFLVANNSNKNLRFMEHNEKTDLWIDLQSNQCIPFWPETTSMQMYIKYRDSKLTSQGFFISNNHTTVLRMDKGTAITVDVTGGKTEPFRIIFNEYKKGDAPVLIENLCADVFLKIQQQGQGQVTLLNPYHSLMYTWDDPTRPRELTWNIYNNKGMGFPIDITKEGYGEERINFHSVTPGTNVQPNAVSSSSEDSDSSDSTKTTLNKKVRRDKIVIYWICYREGLQKILLFTQDQRAYTQIVKLKFMEHCEIEALLSISGVGVSIFTPGNSKKENIYISLADVPANWEVNVGQKWKTLTLELASWIEDKYRLHYKKCQLKDYVHIEFEKMFMLKPFFAELRRSYSPAIYLQYRKSLTHQYINVKLQTLQIDNKQSINNESITFCSLPEEALKLTKPFIEFSVFKSNDKNCDVYKNIQLNVSDFYIHIDSDLILELAEMFGESRKNVTEPSVLFRNDMSLIHSPVTKIPKQSCHNTLIESATLSQIGVQLCISRRNQFQLLNTATYPISNFLEYFFPLNLSAYMPFEGVRHKITPMDIIDTKTEFCDIISSLWNHLSIQFLQQYYSQVLGLQVLVNPYAIQAVPSNEKTVHDFERMANVVSYACRCLLGHINMSSAALEQSVIDIFANQTIENIQRIRRLGSYHKSNSMPRIISSFSRNFNPGVIFALEQIIAKNQTSTPQSDGEVFFRGTGKALHSLITRHPDEKSDSVQVAIEALRRASLLGEPIRIHQRLTRYYNSYLGLKPFSGYNSMGQFLLETVGNFRFSRDIYWAHAPIDRTGKSIIVVSLEHVIRVNKCRLWGPCELEWTLDLDEIISVPKVNSTELVLNVRQGENVDMSTGTLTITGDKEMLIWLQQKIEQAMIVSMEDKSWTITEN